jgi:hypothetical protein
MGSDSLMEFIGTLQAAVAGGLITWCVIVFGYTVMDW